MLLGRFDGASQDGPRFGYPGSGFAARFSGDSLTLEFDSDSSSSALSVVVDHGEPRLALLAKGANQVRVEAPATSWPSAGLPHLVEVYKRTETWQGIVTLRGIVPGGAILLDAPLLPKRRLLFVGDSVTCGAGVNNNAVCKNPPGDPASDAYASYGMLLGRRLDAQSELVCYGGRGLLRDYRGLSAGDGVLNAPEFLDLAIPSDDPARRAPWNPARSAPDGVLVSVGTNDFNLQKSKPLDREAFVSSYRALMTRLRSEFPHAVIFATQGAIVTDPLLSAFIEEAVDSMHDQQILWVPSRHYPGNGCDGHPTGAQHLHMAEDLEPVLRSGLGW